MPIKQEIESRVPDSLIIISSLALGLLTNPIVWLACPFLVKFTRNRLKDEAGSLTNEDTAKIIKAARQQGIKNIDVEQNISLPRFIGWLPVTLKTKFRSD